jgi:hypothetical protein
MQPENSRCPKSEITTRLDLLEALESGMLDSIQCPQCQEHSVSVWFTNPLEDEYRTWFVCTTCAFLMRTQNSVRPKHFSLDRVRDDLEQYDAKVLRKRRIV